MKAIFIRHDGFIKFDGEVMSPPPARFTFCELDWPEKPGWPIPELGDAFPAGAYKARRREFSRVGVAAGVAVYGEKTDE